jgi:hypothetical protein
MRGARIQEPGGLDAASGLSIPEPSSLRVIGNSMVSFQAMFLLGILTAGQGLIQSSGRPGLHYVNG